VSIEFLLQTNQSPGKEDKNRGFAWGKGMLSSGLRLPLKWCTLNHDFRYLSRKFKVISQKTHESLKLLANSIASLAPHLCPKAADAIPFVHRILPTGIPGYEL